MTDLEITQLCAEAMGFSSVLRKGDQVHAMSTGLAIPGIYWPLEDDAQAMALVKKLGIKVGCDSEMYLWYAEHWWSSVAAESRNCNRAICECAAKMRIKTT